LAEDEENKDKEKTTAKKTEEKPKIIPPPPKEEPDIPKETPVEKIPSPEPPMTQKKAEDKPPQPEAPQIKKEEKKPASEPPKTEKKVEDKPSQPKAPQIKVEEKIQEEKPASEPPKIEKKPEDKPSQPEAPQKKTEEKEKVSEVKKEPIKEITKDKPKDKKEEVPADLEKKPKEKKGGDKDHGGKPKETKPQKDDKTDEIRKRLSPLIFGKYDLGEVVVEDPGLRRYINLAPTGLPHSGARHANKSFGKSKVNIVERLINNMMRTEHTTGKKSFTYKTVGQSFDIIAKRTKTNPIQVLIDAIQNSSPKEEITRLRFGGISVPKAVDTSSAHRLDVALRNISKGAVSSSHKNKKRMALCLAEEIILASKADMNSFAVSKKEEMERIAASAR
jgi:small subunit ribosomal protein S7